MRSGSRKMLMQGLADENDAIKKGFQENKPQTDDEENKRETSSPDDLDEQKLAKETLEQAQIEADTAKELAKKTRTQAAAANKKLNEAKAAVRQYNDKNMGGRPTNESKGRKNRKQFSLTLLSEDYEKILKVANEEGLSFAKYVERAVFAYMNSKRSDK